MQEQKSNKAIRGFFFLSWAMMMSLSGRRANMGVVMKIFMVDDDINLLEALKDMLEEHGHEVTYSCTAKEAVKAVKDADFDCILVDYRMPGDDGIWFMENAEIAQGTKVLLMTAYLNREVINRMFELGASGYIVKPFDEEELLTHLDFHGK